MRSESFTAISVYTRAELDEANLITIGYDGVFHAVACSAAKHILDIDHSAICPTCRLTSLLAQLLRIRGQDRLQFVLLVSLQQREGKIDRIGIKRVDTNLSRHLDHLGLDADGTKGLEDPAYVVRVLNQIAVAVIRTDTDPQPGGLHDRTVHVVRGKQDCVGTRER